MEIDQREQKGAKERRGKHWEKRMQKKRKERRTGRSKRKREEGEAQTTTTGVDKARWNEGRRERRKIASSEYGRGIRVGKGAREEAT